MQFEVSTASPLEFSTPVLIVPVWQGGPREGFFAELNEALGGLVTRILEEDGFKAGAGDTRTIYTPASLAAGRVILAGLGKPEKFSLIVWRRAAAKAARAARSLNKTSFAFVLPEVSGIGAEAIAAGAAEGIGLGLHLFNDFKTVGDRPVSVESATLLAPESAGTDALRAAVELAGIGIAANLRARALVNLPANLKSPELLAQTAREIAGRAGLRVEVWDEFRIQEERMGALWGVGMGSVSAPRFIILEYAPPGTEHDRPVAIVGKGMTFDTGGYSLKPSTSMEDMKDDMAGAAVVLAAMEALPQLGVKRRVLGVVASAENMVSERSQRPGDIVTARNGKTIEVLNTDAEGRLILADALSWVSEQNPAEIVDFATLTGAIGVALGQEGGGLFSNDETLGAALVASGEETGERIWPFPMWDEYRDYVKGTISDLKNIAPERRAGSIVGAVFLQNFVTEGLPWAHLDIAAVSLVRDEKLLTVRGATGFGVRLILDHLKGA